MTTETATEQNLHTSSKDDDTSHGSYSSWYEPNSYNAVCATTTTTTPEPTKKPESSEQTTEHVDPYQAAMSFLYGDNTNHKTNGGNSNYGGDYSQYSSPWYNPSQGNQQKDRFRQIFCDCMDDVGAQPDPMDKNTTQKDIDTWNKDFSECMYNSYSRPQNQTSSTSSSTSTSSTSSSSSSSSSSSTSKHHKHHKHDSEVSPEIMSLYKNWNWHRHHGGYTTEEPYQSTESSTSTTDSVWLDSSEDVSANLNVIEPKVSGNNDFAIFALVCWLIGIILILFIFSKCLNKIKKLFYSKKNSDYVDIDEPNQHKIQFY